MRASGNATRPQAPFKREARRIGERIKEWRPTAARGWAPEARLLARAYREGSRYGRTTSSARRGALPIKSDVDRFWPRNMQVVPRFQPAPGKKINEA